MAVSEGKTVSIKTETFSKNVIFGDISTNGRNEPVTRRDVRSIISEVKRGFDKFIQTQLTYAEYSSKDDESPNERVERSEDALNGKVETEEIDITDGNEVSEQLIRIEDNTNSIISQIGAVSDGMSALGTIASAAELAFPEIETVSSIFGSGGDFTSTMVGALKSALLFIITTPVFYLAVAVLFGALYRYALKPYLSPVIDVIDALRDYYKNNDIITILTDIKYGISRLVGHMGIDLMEPERKIALNKVSKLVEESRKIERELRSDDISDARRDELEEMMAKNYEKSQKLAEYIEKYKLDDTTLMQFITNDSDKQRVKKTLKEFVDNSRTIELHERRARTTDKAHEIGETEVDREYAKDALENRTVYSKAQDAFDSATKRFREFVSDINGTKKNREDDRAELYSARREFESMSTNTNSDGFTKNDIDVARSFSFGAEMPNDGLSVAPSANPTNTAEGDSNNVAVESASTSVKTAAEPQFSTDIPKALQIVPTGTWAKVYESDMDGVSDYLKDVVPTLWSDTLSRIKSNPDNDGRSDAEINAKVEKSVMEQYLTGVKQLLYDYAVKKRDEYDEEFSKIVEDNRITKDEIRKYIETMRKGDDGERVNRVRVVISPSQPANSHRSM